MGYYIDHLPDGTRLHNRYKAAQLIMCIDEAIAIPEPDKFIPDLVCVVNNGPFDAAGYAYSEEEMNHFKLPDDRPKQWLIVPGAAELSGFSKYHK